MTASGTVNLFFSRYKDLINGIEIMDPKTGEKRKDLKSVRCGKIAFAECLFVRWFLPIPAMLFPPLISKLLVSKVPLFARNTKAKFLADVLVCYLS